MRSVSVLCACLLTACSTQAVRCDRHLTPINVPERPVAEAPARGQPGRANAQIRGVTQSGGTPRTKSHAQPAAPTRPASGPERSP